MLLYKSHFVMRELSGSHTATATVLATQFHTVQRGACLVEVVVQRRHAAWETGTWDRVGSVTFQSPLHPEYLRADRT